MNLTEKEIDNLPINVMDKVLYFDWSKMVDSDWSILRSLVNWTIWIRSEAIYMI